MTPGLSRSPAFRTFRALRPWAAALALALSATLAACGGSSSDPGDTTAPTLVITSSAQGTTATGEFTYTFTFSEDIGTSFPASDITLTGGTKGVFTKVSGTVTTMVVVPTAATAGTVNLSVAAGAFSDLAGNPSTVPYTHSQPYDTSVTLSQMNLPVTFDSATVEYGLVGFGGAEDSTVVADPTDAANKVAKVVKSATAELWAGTTVTAAANLGFASRVPFSAGNTRMTVRVWSPDAGIPVRLKAENHADNTLTVETEATTTAAGAWQTLTFDFAAQATGTAALDVTKNYDKVSIFFNFGTTGAVAGAKTYYFDDLIFIGGTGGGAAGGFTTLTFDDAAVTYTLTGFGGAEDSTVAVDPANAANHVAKVVKSATAETWAGTTASTGAAQSVGKLPFDAANTRMTVRVYSPAAGVPVRLKVEDAANNTITCETEAVTTAVNTWETLTFEFATPAAGTAALDVTKNFNKVSIFFNFGTGGAATGARTYYFDDVAFIGGTTGGGGGGGGGGTFSTVTFDDAAVTYALTGFGGAEDSTVVVDPANAANHVAKVVKSATAEVWAGTTASTGAAQSVGKLPFDAANTRMTVRVYSPAAGVPVRLKVEDAANNTITCETEAVTTAVNTWETLTFEFATPAAGTAALDVTKNFNKVSIFFNFGTGGAATGARTYYFDDVAFIGGTTGGGGGGGGGGTFSTVTFDDAALTYALTGFGGAEDSTVVADPTDAANKVGKVVKSATAELWAGTTVSTGAAQSVGTIGFSATRKSMSVRVWSPDAGIPVRLKVEDAADVTHTCETEATVTTAAGWQTLTFNFANQAPGTAALNTAFTFNKVSIFFNFGTTGAVAGAKTYYFDDVTFLP